MIRRKAAADRKAEIIDAMLVLADRIGPDRLTTSDVAREVGVTQAAIFRHFSSKDELWAAVGEDLRRRLEEAWGNAAAPADAPERRLRALIEAQLVQISCIPALPTILHSRELGISNGALRDSCHGLMIGFRTRLVQCLEAMARSGALRRDLAPEDAAMLLISLVQGAAIRWTLGARNFDLPAEGCRMLEVQLALFAAPGSGTARPSGQPAGCTDAASAAPTDAASSDRGAVPPSHGRNQDANATS